MAARRPEEIRRSLAGAGDVELRAEVESLLTHHGRAEAEGFAQERKA